MVRAAYCLPVIVAVAVSGCTRTVYLTVPIPSALTAPCVHSAAPQTTGELLEAYEEARLVLDQCNTKLDAIRGLE